MDNITKASRVAGDITRVDVVVVVVVVVLVSNTPLLI